MEGIIGSKKNQGGVSTPKTAGIIRCVFIGKTDKRNGIPLILEASKIAPPHYVFDIYGSGDMDEILHELNSPNIHYHGFLEPSKMAEALARADIVLSPRKAEGKYIYYSFPSKLFDYILYDKKIVTYWLPCYFNDLDEVLFYPSEYNAPSFLAAIEKAAVAEDGLLTPKYAELKKRFSSSAFARLLCSLFGQWAKQGDTMRIVIRGTMAVLTPFVQRANFRVSKTTVPSVADIHTEKMPLLSSFAYPPGSGWFLALRVFLSQAQDIA